MEQSSLNQRPVIKVMSYNIHTCNPPSEPSDVRDIQAIADVINSEQPDLVALSEVDNKTRRSGVTVNQAQELGRLTGMASFFTKAMDFQDGEYGDAVLSRLPILEHIRYQLPTTSDKFEPRSVALITTEKEGRRFHFAITHLDHLADETNRVLQANALVEIINTLTLPLVMAGDWNASPRTETLSILTQTLTPTYADECPLTYPAIKPDRTIDYIMYKPAEAFRCLSLQTINETYASDHLPLIAELELR